VPDKRGMAKKRTKTTSKTISKTISKTMTVAPMMLVRREPDRAAIAARAYALFVARGGEPGRALEDWLAAEAELGA
jgi:hypothetical protein